MFPSMSRVLVAVPSLMLLSPDMFVIGFQEIVPLTAQQIVQTDPEKRYAGISITQVNNLIDAV